MKTFILGWFVAGFLTGFYQLVKAGLFSRDRKIDMVDVRYITLFTLLGYMSPLLLILFTFIDWKWPVGKGERETGDE